MERTNRNLTHSDIATTSKTTDANLRMRAMLFQHKNTVNTAFPDFPVMRLDRICNFAPNSSGSLASDRETKSFDFG